MKSSRLQSALIAVAVTALSATAAASKFAPVPVPDRFRGAERVVVATVGHGSAAWARNEFGDQVSVTTLSLHIEVALKGKTEASVPFDLEGGTVDGVTLEVSSLPSLAAGERAVFFLERGRAGRYQPHLKGQGILKLDRDDHVKGSSLTLTELRGIAAKGGR
jgi:hypothetical protein